MSNPGIRVEIEGLREFRNAIRRVEPGMQKQLQKRFKALAVVVADRIRAKVPVGDTGNAAASVRARATQTSAAVFAGGVKAPYFPFLDFGGSTGRGHVVGSGGGAVRRDMPTGGRYVYPVIGEMRGDITREANKALDDTLHEVGLR